MEDDDDDPEEGEEAEEDDSGHPDAPGPADHVDLMQVRKNVTFKFEENNQDEEPEDGDIEEEDFDEDEFDGFEHVAPDAEGNYDFADNVDAEDETDRIADAFLERMAEMHEEEFGLDDDEHFESALDAVDPVIYFVDALHAFTQRDGAAAQQIIAQLGANYQKLLHGLDAEATQRKQQQNNTT